MSSVRSKLKFANRDYGIQPYRSSKSFAQQMRKTTEKALDDVSVRAQSELVRPYLAPRYEEHEYEATAPSGETSIDLTIPDVSWATIPIAAAQFKVATPIFSVSSGTYSSAQMVQILCATGGAAIYYTLNNTEPNENSTKYTGAITVAVTTTIKAKAFKVGWVESETVEGAYIIQQWGTYFDNTKWEVGGTLPYGSWDGSKWDSEYVGHGNQHVLGLIPISGWEVGYRPVAIRVTHNGATISLTLKDTALNNVCYTTNYVTGTELFLTFTGLDIQELRFSSPLESGPGSAFSITNIEFLA